MSTYTVQQGDSPSSIARKFSMPLADLLAANAQKPTTVVSGVTTWQTLAVGENLSVPSGVGAAAAVAINAMNADPNYCKSVGLPGSPVNIAVHNFKKAWNTAFPLKPLPVGTGKYEVTVAAALASIVGNADPSAVVYAPSACVPHQRPTYSEPMHGVSDAPVGGSATGLPGNTITGGFNLPIPAGGSAKGEPDNTITGGFNTPSAAPPPDPPAISATPQGPSPAALVATGTLVSIAATAAGALSADPNYCKSVGQLGSQVNKAVHDFKKAWNAANPGNTVPVGTGKYEAVVATALMSVLGGAGTAPDGCAGGGKHTAPPAPPAVVSPPPPIPPPAPQHRPAPPASPTISPAAQALAAVDPCAQANVALVSTFQQSAGLDPDGKYGAKAAQALQAQVPGAPAGCSPRPAWWTPHGQRNRPGAPHRHHEKPAPPMAFVPPQPVAFVLPAPPPAPVTDTTPAPDDNTDTDTTSAAAAPPPPAPPAPVVPAPVAAVTPPLPPPPAAPADTTTTPHGKHGGKHQEAGLIPPVFGKMSTGTLIAGGVGAAALVGIVIAAASGGGKTVSVRRVSKKEE